MISDVTNPTSDFIYALENGYRLVRCYTHPDAFDLKHILEYCNRKSPTDEVLLKYLDRANALFNSIGIKCYLFKQLYSKDVRDGLPEIIKEFGHIEWHIE